MVRRFFRLRKAKSVAVHLQTSHADDYDYDDNDNDDDNNNNNNNNNGSSSSSSSDEVGTFVKAPAPRNNNGGVPHTTLTDNSSTNDHSGTSGGGDGDYYSYDDTSSQAFSEDTSTGGASGDDDDDDNDIDDNDEDSTHELVDTSAHTQAERVELPKYHIDDIMSGELLGEGSFCAVYSILCITTAIPSQRGGSGGGNIFQTEYALKRLHYQNHKTIMNQHNNHNHDGGATTVAFAAPNYSAIVSDMEREAWLLQRLQHPNIIHLHAMVLDNTSLVGGAPALVVDRLYRTLREEAKIWMRDRRRTPRQLHAARLVVAIDLAKAIHHLHKYRLLHRDLKPSNVGFDVNGTVKLFDFGFCRTLPPKKHAVNFKKDKREKTPLGSRFGRKSRSADKDTDSIQSSGSSHGSHSSSGNHHHHIPHSALLFRMTAKIGTWRYMAPEVMLGQPYNCSSDTYSFAMICWEMWTGVKPLAELNHNRNNHNNKNNNGGGGGGGGNKKKNKKKQQKEEEENNELLQAVAKRGVRPNIEDDARFTGQDGAHVAIASGRLPLVLQHAWDESIPSRWSMRKIIATLQLEYQEQHKQIQQEDEPYYNGHHHDDDDDDEDSDSD